MTLVSTVPSGMQGRVATLALARAPTHLPSRAPFRAPSRAPSRFAALDGMRALAVAVVIGFHCNISGLLDAGFLGVDMFFAISGFIITAMLIKEYRDDGDFRFRAFYFRRLKRLLPPVVALLLLAGLTVFISDSAFAAFRADVPAALAYASNLWQIVEQQSYFDHTPHVIKHLWSLAVEEQFYFLWPPIAYAVLKRFGPAATGVVAVALACASTAWMGYLYMLTIDGADHNRLYLGTDTHAMGLLAGAALGCFWNPWAAPPGPPSARWRMAAWLALAGLAYMLQMFNPAEPMLYRGALLLVPVLTGVVAYCAMNDPRFIVARLLRSAFMQWLGSRSYSLYLVHWLMFEWTRLAGFNDFTNPVVLAVVLALVAGLSELMYRWIEAPSKSFQPPQLERRTMAGCVIAYTLAAWALFGMTLIPGASAPAPALASAPLPDAVDTPAVAPTEPEPPAPVPLPLSIRADHRKAPDADEADQIIGGGEHLYAMGDSVLLGARGHLVKSIPGIRVDAQVGRQASQGLKVIRQWRSKSGKASTVLLHLGTNGYINEGEFRALLGELADRTSVIVINIHAERRWTAPNNAMIARLAREFANVRVLDWHAISAQRPDYFVNDGIHLTVRGMRALTAQIGLATAAASPASAVPVVFAGAADGERTDEGTP